MAVERSIEQKPGFLEKWSKIFRNVEVGAAAIVLFLGHFGAAAALAIGAGIDHVTAKYFENQRKQKYA